MLSMGRWKGLYLECAFYVRKILRRARSDYQYKGRYCEKNPKIAASTVIPGIFINDLNQRSSSRQKECTTEYSQNLCNIVSMSLHVLQVFSEAIFWRNCIFFYELQTDLFQSCGIVILNW